MENYEQEFNIELIHYNMIISIIHEQLTDAEKDKGKSIQDLAETNKDMWENAPHSADDFDNAVQLSQYYQPLAIGTKAVESSVKKIQLLERLLSSAYFARIDFCEEGNEEYEKIYIGRGMLSSGTEKTIHIFDWRSPISSLFYRFETGIAYYDTPDGRVAGDIALKRQYEIKKGVFEYYFDADVQIADEFLRKMLSGNTNNKMKTIVETIQKDQDIAIRDMTHDLLMVQGIAGSGKTSIALHRVAYLKYQGLSNRLQSSDIIILSPNTLFEQYISNVLPELGEDEVKSIVIDDLISTSLKEKTIFKSRYEQTESLISCTDPSEKELQKQSLVFKMSQDFCKILNRYADSLPDSHIGFTDIIYDERTVFTGQYLKDYLLQMDSKMSLVSKLEHLRKHIFKKIHNLRKDRIAKLQRLAMNDTNHPFDWEEYARELSIRESTCLAHLVDSFTKPDSIALYKKLISTENLLFSLSEGINLPDSIDEILFYSQQHLTDSVMQNEDALAAAYLQLLIGTNDTYGQVRQIVVDEAQDYYSLHFNIMKRLFSNARYTVLGDINQTIEKQENMNLYEKITAILNPAKSCLMIMNKSFRCTKEILTFSMQFLDSDTPFESFNRSGDPPQIVEAPDLDSLDKKIIAEALYSQNKGYQSIGIICKNAQESEILHGRLKDKLTIHLIHSGDNLNTAGVFIIPITMSKGLEFDSVLVYGVDISHYHTADDMKLLYIASTRALHRLNLFYTGEKSPLIQGGITE